MRIRLDPAFWEEQRRYGFRFCCEDCVYWDCEREHCAHGWPHEEHRRAAYEDRSREEVIFCKEFELL